MQEWFKSLGARERKIIVSGTVVLLIVCIYFLGWEPVAKKVERLKKTNVESQQTLTWMKLRADEVKQLRGSGTGGKKDQKGQSLMGVIDKTARRNQLGSAIKRVQPDGKTKALVRLEKANFNKLLLWMEQLQQRQGIQVVNSVIEKQDEPGLVNARITFQTIG